MATWTLHIVRSGIQKRVTDGHTHLRTIGAYKILNDDVAVAGLSGTAVESPGPGDNAHMGNKKRIEAGTYPVWTQDGERYCTFGYEVSTSPHVYRKPAIELKDTGHREEILVHPGYGFIASVGCINLTGDLADGGVDIDFVESRDRITSMINNMKDCLGDACPTKNGRWVANAKVVIEGEP